MNDISILICVNDTYDNLSYILNLNNTIELYRDLNKTKFFRILDAIYGSISGDNVIEAVVCLPKDLKLYGHKYDDSTFKTIINVLKRPRVQNVSGEYTEFDLIFNI